MDLIAGFLGPQWQARDRKEIDRIAKPVSRMVGRNPIVKRAMKKWLAPVLAGGGISSYVLARRYNLPANNVARPPVAQSAPVRAEAPPAAPATHAAPPPQDISHLRNLVQEPAPLIPQRNAANIPPPDMPTADQAQSLIDHMFSITPK